MEIRLDDQSQPLLAFTRDITERTEAVDERTRAATVGGFDELRSKVDAAREKYQVA